MTRPIHLLLVASALAAALGGCASRPKTAPGAAPAEAAQPQAETELPPGRAPTPEGVVRGSQEDLAATAGDRVYFAFDSDALDGEARETLRRQAAWLSAHPDIRARIAGNADERGTREYNLAPGARRAAAARQVLIASGVAATRLETISYGKERPLDPGSDEDAWARNRNAQIVVIGIASP
jgi:peptidoglycan-associated lipoprotein